MSHPIFMVLNPNFCYVSPKIVIFHEPFIIETHNKCHWIWHALNPKYTPLKAISISFIPIKINKMWNFCLKLWFFRNCLLQRLETCGIGFGMPQTLNTHHSSHFDAFFPSQNQQNVKFWLFPELPLTKDWKNINLHREKVFAKACKICAYRFLGMPIAMHYVRTLCDKYFLSYYGFLHFLWEGQDIGFWNMV